MDFNDPSLDFYIRHICAVYSQYLKYSVSQTFCYLELVLNPLGRFALVISNFMKKIKIKWADKRNKQRVC